MPGMDGHEFIQEVRRRMPKRHLNAIAMSGYGRAVDVERAKDAGFDAHIPKPASIDQLKVVVARLFRVGLPTSGSAAESEPIGSP